MEQKKCTVCKETKSLDQFNKRPDRKIGYRSECKRCQYDRQYRRIKKCRQKYNAKHTARIAHKKGLLKKPKFCQLCGKEKPLDKHHSDYNKPLKVIWICRQCHSSITYKDKVG